MAKNQTELPGVRPEHIKRIEDIQDEIDGLDGKIARLKEKKNELNGEAVGIWEEHKLEPMVRGSNEWYLDKPGAKMKRRRHKITAEKEKGAKKNGKGEDQAERKATA